MENSLTFTLKSFAKRKWPHSCIIIITPKNKIATATVHTLLQIPEEAMLSKISITS